MHQELGSGPHHCSSVALIYYPVCLHSYLRPCPPSPSIKHTQTYNTHVCPLTVSTMPSWTLRHMHIYIWLRVCMCPHTLISTPTYSALTTHTYMCSSNGEFSHASFFLPHHSIIVFSSISSCILIFILQSLSRRDKSPRGQVCRSVWH